MKRISQLGFSPSGIGSLCLMARQFNDRGLASLILRVAALGAVFIVAATSIGQADTCWGIHNRLHSTAWDIRQQGIVSLTLSPSTIGGLGTTIGTVTIAEPTQDGYTVNIAAGASGYLNVPSTVTVPPGDTKATFVVTGTGQRSTTFDVGIIASDSNASVEAILTIQGDLVTGLVFSPQTIGDHGTTTGTLTIASPAPPGGWIVNLTPGISGYLSMPTSVVVQPGATTTSFTVSSLFEQLPPMTIGVIASDGNSSVESLIKLLGDALSSISLSPASIGGSGTSTATVTLLSPAPLGGWLVNLTTGTSGYLNIPTSVTVAAGALTATFTISGQKQSAQTLTIRIVARDNETQVNANLTVVGDSLAALTLSPVTVIPGGSSTGTITLKSPAPVGGWTVHVWSSISPDVIVPYTVTVPAGQSTATFPVTTSPRTTRGKVEIHANDGASQSGSLLTIL